MSFRERTITLKKLARLSKRYAMTKKTIIYFILVGIIIYYANFFTSSFTFEPFYSLYSDADQLYFLQHLNNYSLFKFDAFSVYVKNHYLAFGWMDIYRVLLYIFSLPVATKIVSIVLCLFSTIAVYRMGIYLYSQKYAFILSSTFLIYFLSTDSFSGGQPRCFGAFIFCLFCLFFIKERFLFLPFLVYISLFFYPSLSVTLAVTCTLIIFVFNNKLERLKIRKLYIFFMSLIPFFFFIESLSLRPFFRNLEIFQNSKYIKYIPGEGIFRVIYNHTLDILLNFVFNFNEHSKLYIYFTIFLVSVSLIIVVIRKKKVFHLPKAVWLMLLASMISFLVVYPFHITTASRQFVFSMPFFLVFFVSTNIFKLIKSYRFNTVILWLPLIAIFAILHPLFNDTESYKEYKPLYNYIKTLPKDVVIAGHPNSPFVESIPFFSNRAIFFADELRDAWLCVYSAKELRRMHEDLMKAIYADSLDEVKYFISKYNIDYFVIESYFYNDNKLLFDRISNSLYSSDQQIYNLIIKRERNKNNFMLLKFAIRFYNFELKENGYNIFILSSKKIMENR